MMTPTPRLAVSIALFQLAAGTSCASLVVSRASRCLLVQRSKAPNKGEWALPGGSISYQEPSLVAAARELSEETHLSSQAHGVVFLPRSIGTVDVITEGHHFVIVQHVAFVPVSPAVAADLKADDDASAVKWMSIDEVRQLESEKQQREALIICSGTSDALDWVSSVVSGITNLDCSVLQHVINKDEQ